MGDLGTKNEHNVVLYSTIVVLFKHLLYGSKGNKDFHRTCKIISQTLRDLDIPEGQPLDQRSSQAEGSQPHTAALPVPAAAWPSWSSLWPAAGQQHLPGRSASIRSMAARMITAAAGT